MTNVKDVGFGYSREIRILADEIINNFKNSNKPVYDFVTVSVQTM